MQDISPILPKTHSHSTLMAGRSKGHAANQTYGKPTSVLCRSTFPPIQRIILYSQLTDDKYCIEG